MLVALCVSFVSVPVVIFMLLVVPFWILMLFILLFVVFRRIGFYIFKIAQTVLIITYH
jgi:hypothetical protein